ncbi:MAG: type II toxin-antitoxin system HicB family antitoxin [Dehalococcoidia bacterium]|nr:MAG: type II toxin-antitoxin system HicB family antitoxin [Dehalococcoidia bacterium]
MNNRVKDYLGLPYSTFVVPDVTTDNEPCYVAYHPELEGCMSHGDTLEEALHNLAEVTELYISALLDKGLEIPLPQGVGITWDVVSLPSEVEVYTFISPAITPPVFSPVP